MPELENKKQQAGNPNAVATFAITADHPRNSDLLLQSVPGLRLRSRISASKSVKGKDGQERIPIDQAAYLGLFPTIPGMELAVNPAKLSYAVVDPLDEDEALCKRISHVMNSPDVHIFHSRSEIKGCEKKVGKLDAHRMKTLCREMAHLVEVGHATLSKGTLPTLEQIEQLPGKFLLNPGSRVPNTQPVFEEDWDAWFAQLARAGG